MSFCDMFLIFSNPMGLHPLYDENIGNNKLLTLSAESYNCIR